MKTKRTRTIISVTLGLFVLLLPAVALALPGIDISIGDSDSPDKVVTSLKILGLLTILAIAPAILMTMTSFTRIVIVFSFLKQAVGTQQVPPNQIVIGLSLFLTVFVMAPVGQRIQEEALAPYEAGLITDGEALERSIVPVRDFMLRYAKEKDIVLFYEISKTPLPETADEISMKTLIPAFVISELKTAFEMGFMLFIPFIILDIAIASLLMSMGMIMLPPALISLPLKLMLFVLVDGWNLIIGSILRSFGG